MNLWLVCKFSFAFRNISCFISKNILSKVVLIHHISMLTCQSRVSQNPFQTNKSCESYHNYISIGNFKKISVSICHYHRASFMKTFFIAYLEQESFRGSPWLILFYCECVVSFYFCLFSYFCCGVYYLLRY